MMFGNRGHCVCTNYSVWLLKYGRHGQCSDDPLPNHLTNFTTYIS